MANPGIKNGLIAGAIGGVLNICMAAFLVCCAPLVSLAAGAGAGYMTARSNPFGGKSGAAKSGAISGAVAGALTVIGQFIGQLGYLLVSQNVDIDLPGNTPLFPDTDVGPAALYGTGLFIGLCVGVIGIALAAGAGAGTAYIAAPETPAEFGM